MAIAQQGYYDSDGNWHDPDSNAGYENLPPGDTGGTGNYIDPNPPVVPPTPDPTQPPPTPDPKKTPPTPDPTGGGGGGPAGPQDIQPYGGGPYATLARPDYLQGAYKPPPVPSWLQQPFSVPGFTAPTMQQVQGDAGYQLGYNDMLRTNERSAAAQGSILNGGTQRALARDANDYAQSKYGEAFNRAQTAWADNATSLAQARSQNESEYAQQVAQDAQARGINETAFQSDVGNNFNQYGANYQQYLDLITNKRNAQNDYFGQQNALAQNGLVALGLARPTYYQINTSGL